MQEPVKKVILETPGVSKFITFVNVVLILVAVILGFIALNERNNAVYIAACFALTFQAVLLIVLNAVLVRVSWTMQIQRTQAELKGIQFGHSVEDLRQLNSSAQATPDEPERTITCRSCQKEIPAQAKVCLHCKWPVDAK